MADLIARGLGKKANDELVNVNQELATKASQTDLDTVETNVTNINTEITNARGTGANLKERLDTVDATLAQKANESDVRKKAVLIGLNDAASDLLTAIQGGTTVNVLSVPKIKSVTPTKTTYFTIHKNLLNLSDPNFLTGKGFVGTTDAQKVDALYNLSGFIEIEGNEKIYISNFGLETSSPSMYKIASYGATDNLISVATYTTGGYTLPAGTVKIRLQLNAAENALQIEKGGVTAYQAYQAPYISKSIVEQVTELKTDSVVTSFIKNKQVTNEKLADDFLVKLPFLDSTIDLNNINLEGNYIAISSINKPPASNSGWLLKVERYKTNDSSVWIKQTATPTAGTPTTYVRICATGTWGSWKLQSTNNGYDRLVGKKIACFGDSVFGNSQGSDNITGVLATLTGATANNFGFGGTRGSIRNTTSAFKTFDLPNIVDAIVSNNFTPQEQALAADGGATLPSYFGATLNAIKAFNFSTVDYITLAFGTNDLTGDVVLDNESNALDTGTFAGGLRYSLEKLFTAYPKVKILVITPLYRFFIDGSNVFINDSDTYTNLIGKLMKDYVDKTIEVSRQYKTPVLDNYYESGINKFNRYQYFNVNDGVHPKAEGHARIAEKMASTLVSKF